MHLIGKGRTAYEQQPRACRGSPSVVELIYALSAARYYYENKSARLFCQLFVAGPRFAVLGAEPDWTAKRWMHSVRGCDVPRERHPRRRFFASVWKRVARKRTRKRATDGQVMIGSLRREECRSCNYFLPSWKYGNEEGDEE